MRIKRNTPLKSAVQVGQISETADFAAPDTDELKEPRKHQNVSGALVDDCGFSNFCRAFYIKYGKYTLKYPFSG